MHKAFGLNELREMYLSFFETKGHLRLPSFSLIPQHDASILLINAGMTPMKTYFTGEEEPPRKRVCTCQKCIRTPDIENIGKTDRHGTYFEMLGNFSFGDYFKREAIHWSWEFLTSPEWVGLEADRLYPSVYLDDDEAFDIWNKEIGIPAENISRFGKEDNFWEHGSGPCGPCSEIYYDRGPEHGCGKPDCKVGCECDRYIEVWNNVFSQFNNDGKGNYTELKQKNIDTGMGLERLACVCQNVGSLFDVDTVRNITNKVSELTGAVYHTNPETDVSLRIITDHIRSSTMMICDGVLPSNEGRGYVLRRIMRRAARHGKILGVNEPFLYKVCETVIAENKGAYPELVDRQDYIIRVIKTEEESFARTIDGGMKIFGEMLANHKEGDTVFSGADAFKLYDTFGFPIDLTREMAAEKGMTVDQDTFDALMKEQKDKAREARKALGDLGWAGIEFGKDMPATEFVGYDNETCEAKILAIVAEDELQSAAAAGMQATLVLDKTVLYAEMGGQVADHGVIATANGTFVVTDVQKNKGGKYLHTGYVESGSLQVDDMVSVSYDKERRTAIRRAHSATHLLDKALRSVLGDHVHQAGSLVEPDRVRFDFTHFAALTAEELLAVSDMVNEAVLEGYPIVTEELPIEEARQKGAIALFGEKYGDLVRVVDMGAGYSVEFCGGTHLDNTAKVGLFEIESEFSVASGVRRIEAITGRAAQAKLKETRNLLSEAAAVLKTKPETVGERAKQLNEELKELRRSVEQYKAKAAAGETANLLAGAENVGNLKVLAVKLEDADAAKLRQMGDVIRDRDAAVVAVLAAVNGEKITFQAVCGANAVGAGIKAGDIIRTITALCGGKGGGKPDSAMGGGNDISRLAEALAAVKPFVESKLG